MEDKKQKAWYLYSDEGEVVTIFVLKPGWDYFECFNIIEADLYKTKPGFDTKLNVDLETKELKVTYTPIINKE